MMDNNISSPFPATQNMDKIGNDIMKIQLDEDHPSLSAIEGMDKKDMKGQVKDDLEKSAEKEKKQVPSIT